MFAVVDIETTGGNFNKDRIIEIAIVVHNGQKVIEDYSTLVNPLRPIGPFITGLTGISNEMVEDAPTFDQVAERIQELTKGRIFVAHNARFDYGFMKSEYKRLGKPFRRGNLCTVQMSRKVFPDLVSYSLGNLCKDLQIPVDNRHRAFGDAAATAVLLEKLIFNDKKKIIKEALKDELSNATLPPNISRSIVDQLPEDTGVYYFLDENFKKIYIGKSKNIRERAIAHFSNDLNSFQALQMKNEIHHIAYELTGNELAALLLESDEIKRFMPKYNKAQRRKKYRYGLSVIKDEKGYKDLIIDLLHPEKEAIMKFTSKVRGEKLVHSLQTKFEFDPTFKKVDSPKTYNKKADKALKRFIYPEQNLLIIDVGRNIDERCVVQIENGVYKGFGYFEPELTSNNIQEIISCINPFHDNPDVKRIILNYYNKYKKRLDAIAY